MIGRVRALWRYAVKSLQGEELALATVTARGLADDRAWAVYGADGRIGSGKTTRRFRAMARLMDLGATRTAAGVAIALPDGSRVDGPGPAADAALSRWIGEAVALRAEGAIRHHDAGPVHLLSTAALAWAGRELGDGAMADARRFRPNLLVDLPGDGDRPEDALIGRHLAIGPVVLRLVQPTARCAMVDAAQGDLPADPRLLRGLARVNHACLGVYAEVESGGVIARGDGIEVR